MVLPRSLWRWCEQVVEGLAWSSLGRDLLLAPLTINFRLRWCFEEFLQDTMAT
jgi:hypothetical protein